MKYVLNHDLSPELQKWAKHIIGLAQDYGLTFYPIDFLVVSPAELNGIAAYTGFPRRMGHWRYGQEFEAIHKSYRYGAGKIYELVINHDPVYAYLMSTNTLVNQKLVMAHVCGHADFFKNNAWFAHTPKNMVDQMANNAVRAKRIVEKHGEEVVESFLDTCLSIENLIDPYETDRRKYHEEKEEVDERDTPKIYKLPAKDYLDSYINPKESIERQKREYAAEKKQEKKFPNKPERDILGFLIEYAPIEKWQRDILAMVREEAYYFAPQRMTKVINEGYASFWHSRLMTEHLADASEIIDYCDVHAGVVSGTGFNPYKIGIELFREIEDRWNRGAFGPEYDRCESMEEKANWNKNVGRGMEKILQVRKTHNDITFIDEFLTPEFCAKHKLFAFKKVDDTFPWVQESREYEKIKQQLLTQLSNGGAPIIEIEDANFNNSGELLLRHVHDSRPLDKPTGKRVITNLYKIWTRPVRLRTINKTEEFETWSYDGKEFEILTDNGEFLADDDEAPALDINSILNP